MISGELVALYSGYKFVGDAEIDEHEKDCENNPELDEATRLKCAVYRYSSPYGYTIDVPYELSGSYRTTVGFKANHSFRNNCGFIAIDHPRSGFITGIVALQDIKMGEEIFTYYGYEVQVPQFKWYFDLKEEFEKGLV